MHNFFARDTIALPGFAKYFDDASAGGATLAGAAFMCLRPPCPPLFVLTSCSAWPAEERLHAQKLMYVQNVRGGRVKLLSISAPETEVPPPPAIHAVHACARGVRPWSLGAVRTRG